MDISIYVHIPYCVQRCTYCDFTAFKASQLPAEAVYLEAIKNEIQNRSHLIPFRKVRTIYFGGGTPSLFKPESFQSILETLSSCGFDLSSTSEMTMEIDPGTVTWSNVQRFMDVGFNRWSVGAQTFSAEHLRSTSRQHTPEQTHELLTYLQKRELNYSLDLLFALPRQTLEELRTDLSLLSSYRPPHLSAYCLTVGSQHPMAKDRPDDDTQILMFDEIELGLSEMGLQRYELSNFSRPGFESQHNLGYWNFKSCWGLGVSAHSFFEPSPRFPYGLRFWNPPSLKTYFTQTTPHQQTAGELSEILGSSQIEILDRNEALFDFCHTQLRLSTGLDLHQVERNHSTYDAKRVDCLILDLARDGWVEMAHPGVWVLTREGRLLSNLVFERLSQLTTA